MVFRNWLQNRALLRRVLKVCISSPDKLWKNYVLALAFVVAMIATVHVVSMKSTSALETHAELVNMASDQRMLSQRILFYMNRYAETGSPTEQEEFSTAAVAFEQAHKRLSARTDLPPEVESYYKETGAISLETLSRRFAAMALYFPYSEGEERQNIRAQMNLWAKTELLNRFDTMIGLLKTGLGHRVSRLHQIQKTAFFSALVVLVGEALLIFLPAHIGVNRAFRRLERRKKQLKSSLVKLRARNNELVAARKNLTRAANHDALTGLLNRRAIYEHMGFGGETSQGADFTRCVMKIDLDRFKQINDSLGHHAGDSLLARVARILDEETGEADLVGRIGGDEFVVLIDNPRTLAAIEDLAQRIVESVSAPVELEGVQCKIGASIGYTFAISSDATPDQLLIEADLALYEAKRAGRGKALAYSDALAMEIESRRMLFKEIATALSRDQFEAYLQPQLYTETGEIYGCEVLARWRHPVHGVVPPATFIAAAEEAGLVDQIDLMILEKGLNALEALHAEGIEIPSISVNASPSTLRDPHLVDRLLQAVQERHFGPGCLTIEVLESTLIENENDKALHTVSALSEAGFTVVLDDFGTGYASMSNLSMLQLDGIKLDQSLVAPVPDPRADSIIAALVTLSRSLEMTVVAEGVETQEHLDTLRGLGCDVVQGFGVGKPMPLDTFMEWWQNHVSRDSKTGTTG